MLSLETIDVKKRAEKKLKNVKKRKKRNKNKKRLKTLDKKTFISHVEGSLQVEPLQLSIIMLNCRGSTCKIPSTLRCWAQCKVK